MRASTIRAIILTMVIAIASVAYSGLPTQYDTVVEAIESTNEYYLEDGSLVVVSEEPLHIEVHPTVVPGDLSEVIEEITKRDVVYALIISFAQTNVSEITISSVPSELDFKTMDTRLRPNYKRTITVSREKFKKQINEYLHLSRCSDLVGPMKIGKDVIPDMVIDRANTLMYNDQGFPGLNRFYSKLVK